MRIVFLGLSVTSSWGNGHAVTYRSLIRELSRLGHDVLFLERDVPWYAGNRDLPEPPWCRAVLYGSLDELKRRHADEVREADAVIVGSYVPEGAAVGDWVTAEARGAPCFYDIDTPVTLARLAGGIDYLRPDLIPRYALYLSFTGGPTLEVIERRYGSPAARPLYCSVDPETYFPEPAEARWDLGYMGTYSDDRQPALDRLLLAPARALPGGRFVVAGPQYPDSIDWPDAVERIEHLPPAYHRAFYNAQRFTLNVTRTDMVRAGWSPSIRLFEAGACATPIISDAWPGLAEIFAPDKEIVVAKDAGQALACLRDMDDGERAAMGKAARDRVLAEHASARRAEQLVGYLREIGA